MCFCFQRTFFRICLSFTALIQSAMEGLESFLIMYTAKHIRRFYGKITCNQLPVRFMLFLQAPVNIFRNQAQYGSKGHVLFLFLFFFCIQPFNPTKVFSGAVGYRNLISKNVLQVDARKNTSELAARCQVFYRTIYGFLQCRLQSNFNCSNTFGTMNKCSRQGYM